VFVWSVKASAGARPHTSPPIIANIPMDNLKDISRNPFSPVRGINNQLLKSLLCKTVFGFAHLTQSELR
jgi:hypothetical protein